MSLGRVIDADLQRLPAETVFHSVRAFCIHVHSSIRDNGNLIGDFLDTAEGLAARGLLMLIINALEIDMNTVIGEDGSLQNVDDPAARYRSDRKFRPVNSTVLKDRYEMLIETLTYDEKTQMPCGYRFWFVIHDPTIVLPDIIRTQIRISRHDRVENKLQNNYNLIPELLHLMILSTQSYVTHWGSAESSPELLANVEKHYLDKAKEELLPARDMNDPDNEELRKEFMRKNRHRINQIRDSWVTDESAIGEDMNPINPDVMMNIDNIFSRFDYDLNNVIEIQRDPTLYMTQLPRADDGDPKVYYDLEFDPSLPVYVVPYHFVRPQQIFNVAMPRDKNTKRVRVHIPLSDKLDHLRTDHYAVLEQTNINSALENGMGENNEKMKEHIGDHEEEDPYNMTRDQLMDKQAAMHRSSMMISVNMDGLAQQVDTIDGKDVDRVLADTQFTTRLRQQYNPQFRDLAKRYRDSKKPEDRAMYPELKAQLCARAIQEFEKHFFSEEKSTKRTVDVAMKNHFVSCIQDPENKPLMYLHVPFDTRPTVSTFFNDFVARELEIHRAFRFDGTNQTYSLMNIMAATRHTHEYDLKCNGALGGRHEKGKSYLLRALEKCSVPGTTIRQTGRSNKVDSTGHHTDGMILLWEELQMDVVEGNNGENTGSGHFKDLLTSCIDRTDRFKLNDTSGSSAMRSGTRFLRSIDAAPRQSNECTVTSHRRVLFFGTNETMRMEQLEAILSRFLYFPMNDPGIKNVMQVNTDRITELIASLEQDSNPFVKKICTKRQLDDMYIYFVNTFIKIGILSRVDMKVYMSVHMRFFDKMAEYGIRILSKRDNHRMYQIARQVCILARISQYIHSPAGPIRMAVAASRKNKGGGQFTLDHLMLLDPALYIDMEMSIYAITLCSPMYTNLFQEQLAHLIIKRFSNDFDPLNPNRLCASSFTQEQREHDLTFFAKKYTGTRPSKPIQTNASHSQWQSYILAAENYEKTAKYDPNRRIIDATENEIQAFIRTSGIEPLPTEEDVRTALRRMETTDVTSEYYVLARNQEAIDANRNVYYVNRLHKVIDCAKTKDDDDPVYAKTTARMLRRVYVKSENATKTTPSHGNVQIGMPQRMPNRNAQSTTGQTPMGSPENNAGSYRLEIFIGALATPVSRVVEESLYSLGYEGMSPRVVLRGDKHPEYTHLNQVFEFPSSHKLYQNQTSTVNTMFMLDTEARILSRTKGQEEYDDLLDHYKGALREQMDVKNLEERVARMRLLELWGVDMSHQMVPRDACYAAPMTWTLHERRVLETYQEALPPGQTLQTTVYPDDLIADIDRAIFLIENHRDVKTDGAETLDDELFSHMTARQREAVIENSVLDMKTLHYIVNAFRTENKLEPIEFANTNVDPNEDPEDEHVQQAMQSENARMANTLDIFYACNMDLSEQEYRQPNFDELRKKMMENIKFKTELGMMQFRMNNEDFYGGTAEELSNYNKWFIDNHEVDRTTMLVTQRAEHEEHRRRDVKRMGAKDFEKFEEDYRNTRAKETDGRVNQETMYLIFEPFDKDAFREQCEPERIKLEEYEKALAKYHEDQKTYDEQMGIYVLESHEHNLLVGKLQNEGRDVTDAPPAPVEPTKPIEPETPDLKAPGSDDGSWNAVSQEVFDQYNREEDDIFRHLCMTTRSITGYQREKDFNRVLNGMHSQIECSRKQQKNDLENIKNTEVKLGIRTHAITNGHAGPVNSGAGPSRLPAVPNGDAAGPSRITNQIVAPAPRPLGMASHLSGNQLTGLGAADNMAADRASVGMSSPDPMGIDIDPAQANKRTKRTQGIASTNGSTHESEHDEPQLKRSNRTMSPSIRNTGLNSVFQQARTQEPHVRGTGAITGGFSSVADTEL